MKSLNLQFHLFYKKSNYPREQHAVQNLNTILGGNALQYEALKPNVKFRLSIGHILDHLLRNLHDCYDSFTSLLDLKIR